MQPHTFASAPLWVGFAVVVLIMLALDLGVFHRKAHAVSTREALIWSVVWVSVSLLFNLVIYFYAGQQVALEFLTGYLIEKSLSVDNIFVFVVMFTYFRVSALYQHRILYWGILGALAMRGAMIGAGLALIHKFHWIIFVFGFFLIYTGIKLLVKQDEEVHPERTLAFRVFRRFVPTARGDHGGRFTVIENGKRKATHLLMVLTLVEATDLVFAVDSIPAIFAVTDDVFVIYTSNIFAILGLRAMYFLLAGVLDKFRFLKIGLALVLSFVGVKMVISDWYKIPIAISLVVVLGLLVGSMVLSLIVKSPPPPPPVDREPAPPLPEGMDKDQDKSEQIGSGPP